MKKNIHKETTLGNKKFVFNEKKLNAVKQKDMRAVLVHSIGLNSLLFYIPLHLHVPEVPRLAKCNIHVKQFECVAPVCFHRVAKQLTGCIALFLLKTPQLQESLCKTSRVILSLFKYLSQT